MATRFRILTWKIPWTETGGVSSPWGCKGTTERLSTHIAISVSISIILCVGTRARTPVSTVQRRQPNSDSRVYRVCRKIRLYLQGTKLGSGSQASEPLHLGL